MKGAGVLIGILAVIVLFLALTVGIISAAPYLALVIILILVYFLYRDKDFEDDNEP